MTEQLKKQAESFCTKIDGGLLHIYHAKENGYSFVDFTTPVRGLLSIYKEVNGEGILKKYHAVFEDLNKEVGRYYNQITQIDTNAKMITYKVITHYSAGYGESSVEEHKAPIPEERFEYYKKLNIDDIEPKSYPITKWDFYLGESTKTNTENEDIEHWGFMKDFAQIFIKYGFLSKDSEYSFEKYIQELQSLQTFEGEKIYQTNIQGPRGKLVLLYELGILKHLKEKYPYLEPEQMGKLLSIITGNTNVDQLAKEYPAIMEGRILSGKGGTVRNKDSVKKVKDELRDILKDEDLPKL